MSPYPKTPFLILPKNGRLEKRGKNEGGDKKRVAAHFFNIFLLRNLFRGDDDAPEKKGEEIAVAENGLPFFRNYISSKKPLERRRK